MPLSAYRMAMTEIEHGVPHPDGYAYAFDPSALEQHREWMSRLSEPSRRIQCSQVQQIVVSKDLSSRIFNSKSSDKVSLLVLADKAEGDLGNFVSRRPATRSRPRFSRA